ncbi:MAG: hypothetical protein OHK0046_29010 [Anaerolineae bacterium]
MGREDLTTRHLDLDNAAPPVPRRGTGPLDFFVPWVIELRVIGTPEVIQVQLSDTMIIGRGGKGSQTLPDIDFEAYNGYQLGVSRRHAVISALNSRISIRDLNSSNGTFLNGGRLQPEYEYRLMHGDKLALGELELQVSFVLTPSSHEKNGVSYNGVDIPKIGSGERVLIVEDDERVARTIGSILETAGFRVSIAPGVIPAITACNRQMPDAVVMNLILPDRSALDLVYDLRTRNENRNLPIIMVSGASGGYQMGQAISAGVDVFLTKPVGVDELIRCFTKIMPQMRAS